MISTQVDFKYWFLPIFHHILPVTLVLETFQWIIPFLLLIDTFFLVATIFLLLNL